MTLDLPDHLEFRDGAVRVKNDANTLSQWWVLVRINPPRDEMYQGVRYIIPQTITPISINTNREYLEALKKNGGDFKIVEVAEIQ